MNGKEIIPRILRDMKDGVLVLDMQGTIMYLNEQGQKLLGESVNPVGKKYAAAFLMKNNRSENDHFHQFVLDAVYDKENSHNGEASYLLADNEKRHFNMTSSFLLSDDKETQIGIVVLFSDITEIARLNQQRRESSNIFVILISCLCFYLFMWSAMRYVGIEPTGWMMTLIIEAIAIVMFFVTLKTTSFSICDIGIRVRDAKATFLPDIIITVVACAVLVVLKLVLLRINPDFFPEGASFWDWRVMTVADFFYPLTAVLQEFLARGVMQENLRRIFVGKSAGVMSIVLSSLVFGVFHIFYGLPYMLGAALLLGALGVLYYKQGNIWGLSLIHYVVGTVAKFLRFLI